MKKKPARTTSAKKAAPKKKVSAKKAVRKVASSPAKTHSHWTKPRLHNEQVEFYDQHPNARNLIMIFLIVTGVFVLTYLMTMM